GGQHRQRRDGDECPWRIVRLAVAAVGRHSRQQGAAPLDDAITLAHALRLHRPPDTKQQADGRQHPERAANQYATRHRAARSTSASVGRNTSSRGGEYGTGVSSAPTTRTGASSHSKASSCMI